MRMHQILGAAVVLLALAGIAAAGPAITDGLIAYYDFEGFVTGGGTVTDGSGHNYTGTVHNADGYPLQSVTGYHGSGKGVYFDNRNLELLENNDYDYIDLPCTAICNDGRSPSGNFSISAWFKLDDYGTATDTSEVFSAQSSLHSGGGNCVTSVEICGPARGNYYRYVLRADDYVKPPATVISPSVGSLTSRGTDDNRYYGDAVTPPLGSWHHLAMTYDKDEAIYDPGTETTYYGTFKMYQDGELIQAGVVTPWADELVHHLISEWDMAARIGALATGTHSERGFTGAMDEVYLFNRTLSASEIGTLSIVPEPSAIALLIAAGLSALAYCRWKR